MGQKKLIHFPAIITVIYIYSLLVFNAIKKKKSLPLPFHFESLLIKRYRNTTSESNRKIFSSCIRKQLEQLLSQRLLFIVHFQAVKSRANMAAMQQLLILERHFLLFRFAALHRNTEGSTDKSRTPPGIKVIYF